jgi:hypothetical protein
MKIKIQTVTTKEIDLQSLPFIEWPEEAKEAAKAILSNPRHLAVFQDQLGPEMKKSWITAKVEKYFEISNIMDSL